MKVSEITTAEIADYLRIDEGEAVITELLPQLQAAAVSFITSFTGLTEDELDEHEDFYTVVLILCQDMYDNRCIYVDKSNLNKVVETILGLHRVNLL